MPIDLLLISTVIEKHSGSSLVPEEVEVLSRGSHEHACNLEVDEFKHIEH